MSFEDRNIILCFTADKCELYNATTAMHYTDVSLLFSDCLSKVSMLRYDTNTFVSRSGSSCKWQTISASRVPDVVG